MNTRAYFFISFEYHRLRCCKSTSTNRNKEAWNMFGCFGQTNKWCADPPRDRILIPEDVYKSIRQHSFAPACRLPHHSGWNHVFHIERARACSQVTRPRRNLAVRVQILCALPVYLHSFSLSWVHPQSAMDSVFANTVRSDATTQFGTGPKNEERRSVCARRLKQYVQPQTAAHSQQTLCTPRLTVPLCSIGRCTFNGCVCMYRLFYFIF